MTSISAVLWIVRQAVAQVPGYHRRVLKTIDILLYGIMLLACHHDAVTTPMDHAFQRAP